MKRQTTYWKESRKKEKVGILVQQTFEGSCSHKDPPFEVPRSGSVASTVTATAGIPASAADKVWMASAFLEHLVLGLLRCIPRLRGRALLILPIDPSLEHFNSLNGIYGIQYLQIYTLKRNTSQINTKFIGSGNQLFELLER